MAISLKGQLLVATPGMSDERFFESIIYVVGHNEDGAMGLVINHIVPGMQFSDILEEMQLGDAEELIMLPENIQEREIFCGGPVERGRGFVLHSTDYFRENNSYLVDDGVCLTASIDVLKAIAFGPAPENALLALGYCGWSPGQLENEIKHNGWLTTSNSNELLFETPTADRYDRALKQIGVTRASLSPVAGNA